MNITLEIVATHEDIKVYACLDQTCWREIDDAHIMNLATGEVLTVEGSEVDENGKLVRLACSMG